MDAEGVAPAKKYYDKYGVTFPALVDPDFATGFGYVPWTFFVDEHGVVRAKGDDWEPLIQALEKLKPVTPEILARWSDSKIRLSAQAIAELAQKQAEDPDDLELVTDLASRYLTVGRRAEATTLLRASADKHQAREIARTGSAETKHALSRVYLQLSRALEGDRPAQVTAARTAYFLAPSIGLAKQISRIAEPARFDDRPDGRLDNPYRNHYAKQIQADREAWLRAVK